jgi:SAM-dependent methyltransferase
MKEMTEKENGKDIQRMYYDLAWTWPIISPPEDYVEEAEIIADRIKNYSKIPVKTLLNLGCGGGHEDFTLKKYFHITGVDLSENMLKLARELNPENNYLGGDLRSVRLKEKFDSVIATSLMYMKTQEELRSAFQTAYEHLNPGGVLVLFIEKTKEQFKQNDTFSSTHKSGDIELVYIENCYDPDLTDNTFELTLLYLIRRKGELEIEKDSHLCGVFSLDTWLEQLIQVGFEVIVEEIKLENTLENEPFYIVICVKPS